MRSLGPRRRRALTPRQYSQHTTLLSTRTHQTSFTQLPRRCQYSLHQAPFLRSPFRRPPPPLPALISSPTPDRLPPCPFPPISPAVLLPTSARTPTRLSPPHAAAPRIPSTPTPPILHSPRHALPDPPTPSLNKAPSSAGRPSEAPFEGRFAKQGPTIASPLPRRGRSREGRRSRARIGSSPLRRSSTLRERRAERSRRLSSTACRPLRPRSRTGIHGAYLSTSSRSTLLDGS